MAALDFRGQTVWVTGAGKGIGYATALAFVEAGANVTGFDLAFDGESYPFATETLDVADADQVREACSRLLANTERLDVLVNAAGILRMGATDQLSAEDWQQTFAVNVGGAFNLFQQTMAQFRRQRGGAIVTVASDAAHTPRIGMSAYGASKAALKSLALTVGLELAGCGVRCNLVSPGSTDTDMQRTLWSATMQSSSGSAASASSLSSASRWVKSPARRRSPIPFCSSPLLTPAISPCRISWLMAARRWGRKWPGSESLRWRR